MTTPQGKGRAPAAPRKITAELVRAALACIPPDVDRDTWARVAMAVKAADEFDQAQAFELWNEWSSHGESYSERDARDTWRSIKAHGSVTVATLFGIAKDHGFKFPKGTRSAQTSAQDAAEAARLADEKRRKSEAEAAALAERQEESARRCLAMWEAASEAPPAMGVPYLKRKKVGAHGLRFLPGGVALVPMRDAAGRLWSVQRLLPKALKDKDGKAGTDKLYGPLKASPDEVVSSRKTGLWHQLGNVDGAAVLLLAEGYATAASVHEATGRPVAVAFDAGNLVHVARELRGLHPSLPLLVCGDDDQATAERTGKNPGRDKAAAAVQASNGTAPAAAVFPAFPVGQAEGRKDFNDLAAIAGADAVRAIIEPACADLVARCGQAPAAASGGREDAEAPAGDNGGASGPPGGPAGPSDADAPGGGRDPFELSDSGVWYTGRDREGNDKKPLWLCAPLAVTARTRADDGNGWGYLLEFADPDGTPKVWAMPSAMLSGEGAEWAGRLRDMGLRMAPGSAPRNLIAQYIDTRGPQDRVTCTDRVGWHGGVYVLPSGSIGSTEGRRFVFQSDAGMEDTFRRSGTLAQWRDEVAALARGNSRLVLTVCTALAGPMARLAGMEGGGFHLRGTSSMGKTTALKVAASVWGRPNFMQTWRNTSNALEGTSLQHSDCCLILDELGQMDAREAGDCAYLLANGQEKGRNTRAGFNRKRRTWRLLFLSSGEISLADHMADAGKRVQAGMEVRMVDVPLDAGAGMGGLEERHGFEQPAELADAITAAAARRYGTAGRAWLEWACENYSKLPDLLLPLIERYRAAMVPESASEQVRRVGSRFALVAAAGELATEAGLTGWPAGHAEWGVRRCFEAWLGSRGHLENGEHANALRQVRACLEKNGDALFTWMNRGMDDHKPSTPLRLGFKRAVDEQGRPLKFDSATEYLEKLSAAEASEKHSALVEYLILPEQFRREVCKGLAMDVSAVARLLRARGHLEYDEGRLTKKQRLPGMGSTWCYHVKPSIFGDELAFG